LPLGSSELTSLAQVKFFGQTPTPVQTQYTPTQIGAFMAGDRASDEYAYSNSQEDAAMLIEEFLMAYRHGLRRNTAILDQFTDDISPFTLPVYWGQRGRIGEAAIRPRIRFLIEQMVPWVDPASVNSLEAPIAMRTGERLLQNLVLP
jgi:hypothetical protein